MASSAKTGNSISFINGQTVPRTLMANVSLPHPAVWKISYGMRATSPNQPAVSITVTAVNDDGSMDSTLAVYPSNSLGEFEVAAASLIINLEAFTASSDGSVFVSVAPVSHR